MSARDLVAVGAIVGVMAVTQARACSYPNPEAWIFFEANSAVMWEGSKPAIKTLVDQLVGMNRRCFRLRIEAHLDGAEAIGDRSDLSNSRMEVVELELASVGIHISARKDHAYDKPLVLTPFGVGEAQNRRVVVGWSWTPGGRYVRDSYVKDEVDYCFGPPARYILPDGTDCGYLR